MKFNIAWPAWAVGSCGEHEYITHVMVDNTHQYNLDEYSSPNLSHGPVCVYVCDLFSYLMLSTHMCVCVYRIKTVSILKARRNTILEGNSIN